MQFPRRSVRSIQELPSIYTVFPANYKPLRTYSASTASESARSLDIEDGLEVVPLERDSALSAPIVSAYLDEKEVFIVTHGEVQEKPLPSVPRSMWDRTWGRMSVKYRVFAVLGLQAVVLLTVGISLLAANTKHSQNNRSDDQGARSNDTNTTSITPIQRGTFAVPIQSPQQQSSKCLARSNESRTWQCAFDTNLQLTILPSLGNGVDEPIMITLGLPSTSNQSIHCGQQAPQIGPTALTADIDADTANGESQYHFSATYDRTVILREDQLGLDKIISAPMQGQPKHTIFLPGQSLWRCTFNDTRMEGFIHVGKDNGLAANVTEPTSGAVLQLPYRLELLEHSSPTDSVPYCEKVVVDANGVLQESGESMELQLSDALSGSSLGQDQADTSCQCQWLVE